MNKQRIFAGILLAVSAMSASAGSLSDQVSAMSESGRRNFTGMLIRQSGANCPAVQRTFFQGKLDKNAVWNVACNSRDNYGIVFYGDDSNTTRVMKCSELKELGAPGCFKKF
ncbi:hypothetical protein QTH97_13865 [Variovorax sp. J22R24]|uniref:hypothetical protein n=1 Tax=Variovorax gracilis TaxID=3053502 RepID=UPI002578C350|nr:hypothetical protein [Variovorax sp. J22R24]MDM0106025.1 hypothetical protein [Variovorax sp. J22R24]